MGGEGMRKKISKVRQVGRRTTAGGTDERRD